LLHDICINHVLNQTYLNRNDMVACVYNSLADYAWTWS
jgi:hypothetical protein